MNSKKVYLALTTASIMTLGISGSAMAFHDGGVAKCNGCHSMHQSADGAPVAGSTANSWLMKGSDASSTCLNCHGKAGGYGIASTDGSNLAAGGDFYWMKTSYSYSNGRGGMINSPAENHGHNIVAKDFGFLADADLDNAVAPGGTYAATKLGCTSCHDAHGQVQGGTKQGQKPIEASGSYGNAPSTPDTILGNYRILGDSAYTAGSIEYDNHPFANDAPVAVALNATTGVKAYGASVAYGSGMSEWCANCHAGLLVSNSSTGKHPSGNDVKIGGYAGNYNSYVKTGDFTGAQATSYDALVPFERGVGATLDPTSTAGPAAGTDGNVMCLTCHRAHATAFPNMGRFSFDDTLIAEGGALVAQDAGAIPATAALYYKDNAIVDVHATYGEFQRSLCNKCHVQD